MRRTLLTGGLLGGLAAFLWSAISWMALPWHDATLQKLKAEDAVAQILRQTAPEDGVYIIPNVHGGTEGLDEAERKAKEAEGMEKMKRGPFVFLSFKSRGTGSMALPMALSFAINVLAAIVFTWLLLQAPGLSFGRRVMFVVAAALAGAVVCHLPYWNWWGFSAAYTAVAVADVVAGWGLAGLAIAWAVGRKKS